MTRRKTPTRAKVWALVGQKGGVGKTTTATNLAAEALRRGWRVLLVDSDRQGTARTWAAVGLAAGKAVPAVEAIHLVHECITQLVPLYDLIVIDAPPGDADSQRSALVAADVAILPCGPAAPDCWAIYGSPDAPPDVPLSIDIIRAAQQVHPALDARVLLTRKRHNSLSQGVREGLQGPERLPVLASELALRTAFEEAMICGQGVTTYAPKTQAAAEVRALFEELVR